MFISEFKCIEDIAREYLSVDNWECEKTKAKYQALKQELIDLLRNSTIYLAWYDTSSYSGTSWVIYEHKGKLYEVNASHCSCYGLEGQWSPEETSWKAIAMRDFEDYDYDEGSTVNEYIKKLCKEHLHD